ncbi:MAG: hypothetical protein NVSMB56_18910 [Pyrinomonadaceae bacterium]
MRSNKRRTTFLLLYVASIVGIGLTAIYFVLLILYLWITGATYSVSLASGAMACHIPIFTRETFLWTSFEFFGVPILILLALSRTAQVLYKRLF